MRSKSGVHLFHYNTRYNTGVFRNEWPFINNIIILVQYFYNLFVRV